MHAWIEWWHNQSLRVLGLGLRGHGERYEEIQGKGIKMMSGKSFPEDGLCEEVMPNSSVLLTDWDVLLENDLAIFKNTSNHTQGNIG